jgi:hypothetical protein
MGHAMRKPAPRLSRDAERVLELFAAVQHYRDKMENAFLDYMQFVEDHPQIEEDWRQFMLGGGTTIEELKACLLHGRKGRVQTADVKNRKLMRLVIDNKPAKKSIPRVQSKRNRKGGGGDARPIPTFKCTPST